MTVFAKWWGSRSTWCGLGWLDGVMTRFHVWLDGGMTVGMLGADVRCAGHGGMLGNCVFGGAGVDGLFGGGEAVGTLRGGGEVGISTLGGRAEIPDQRVIAGVVG